LEIFSWFKPGVSANLPGQLPLLPISSKGIEAWLSRIRVAILCAARKSPSAWAFSSKARKGKGKEWTPHPPSFAGSITWSGCKLLI
jgi:hypothetical protein